MEANPSIRDGSSANHGFFLGQGQIGGNHDGGYYSERRWVFTGNLSGSSGLGGSPSDGIDGEERMGDQAIEMGARQIHGIRPDGGEVDRRRSHIGHITKTHGRKLPCGPVITNSFTTGKSAVHVGTIG